MRNKKALTEGWHLPSERIVEPNHLTAERNYMLTLSHHCAFCHAEFLALTIGKWCRRCGLEPLTQGGRHLKRRTRGLSNSMANTLAEIHGLGSRSSKFGGTA